MRFQLPLVIVFIECCRYITITYWVFFNEIWYSQWKRIKNALHIYPDQIVSREFKIITIAFI